MMTVDMEWASLWNMPYKAAIQRGSHGSQSQKVTAGASLQVILRHTEKLQLLRCLLDLREYADDLVVFDVNEVLMHLVLTALPLDRFSLGQGLQELLRAGELCVCIVGILTK